MSLDITIAHILSNTTNIRAFDNLKVISPEVAWELSWVNGILDLKLDRISLDVARALSRHQHELYLHTKLPPSEQVLSALCDHWGYHLEIGRWAYQPGNALCGFVSPNAGKAVYFDRYQNKLDGEWIESVHIGEDLERWRAKRNLDSFSTCTERCETVKGSA